MNVTHSMEESKNMNIIHKKHEFCRTNKTIINAAQTAQSSTPQTELGTACNKH